MRSLSSLGEKKSTAIRFTVFSEGLAANSLSLSIICTWYCRFEFGRLPVLIQRTPAGAVSAGKEWLDALAGLLSGDKTHRFAALRAHRQHRDRLSLQIIIGLGALCIAAFPENAELTFMADDEISAGRALFRHLGSAAIVVKERSACFVLALPEMASGLLLKALERPAAIGAFGRYFWIKQRHGTSAFVLINLPALGIGTGKEKTEPAFDPFQRASAFFAFKLRLLRFRQS